MAYVPPHRRKKDGSAKKEYCYYRDDDIDENTFRIWFGVDANINPSPNLKVSFKPFADTSIPQLQGTRVFTLSVDDAQSDATSFVNKETPPWRYSSNKIKDDLAKCFYKLENHIILSKKYSIDYVKPVVTARFGKNLFHSSQLTPHESITLENVEKMFNPNSSRTFDTNIPEDIFEATKQKAIRSLQSPTLKEKVAYWIVVRDDLNGIRMLVTCCKKDINDKQIELKKIQLVNLRHFLADTSCLNKVMDWRLSVTERYLVDLDEEDKECIEGIVKSARIQESAKGGLVWPPESLVRKKNRFHIRAVWILSVSTIVGKTRDIKFQHVERMAFNDSKEIEDSWTMTNEIDLKLKGISKHLREQKEWEEEKIMKILEDSLKWVWMEALS